MTDNEKIRALMQSLVNALNASHLPMAVKELALENIMLHIKIAEADAEDDKGSGKDA